MIITKLRRILGMKPTLEEMAETPDAIQTGEQGLVVATGSELFSDKNIYAVEEGKKYLVAKAQNWVCAFASHNGKLYHAEHCFVGRVSCTSENKVCLESRKDILDLVSDGKNLYCIEGGGKILNALTGKKIANRNYVYSCGLGVHKGKLYDAGHTEISMFALFFREIEDPCPAKVFDTLNNKVIWETKWPWFEKLVSDGNNLYAKCISGVYSVFDKKQIASRDNNALCIHNGRPYDSTGGSDQKGLVYDSLSNLVVAERTRGVTALASDGSYLYDGGYDQAVYNTLNDPKGEKPLWVFESGITCIAGIPKEIWENLARKGRLVK